MTIAERIAELTPSQGVRSAERKSPLTDEEIERIASGYMHSGWDEEPPHDHPNKEAAYTEIAFKDGLRYARDHGYFSIPVDKLMEVIKQWAIEFGPQLHLPLYTEVLAVLERRLEQLNKKP